MHPVLKQLTLIVAATLLGGTVLSAETPRTATAAAPHPRVKKASHGPRHHGRKHHPKHPRTVAPSPRTR